MSKAVLISIQPQRCEKIVVQDELLEVRKTKPKIQTPFTCYIYCTKAPKGWFWFGSPNIRRDGMVIGEFVCDEVKTILADSFVAREDALRAIEGTCLTIQKVKNYAGWKKGMQLCDCEPIYGWHISELVIYDKPRPLSYFTPICKFRNEDMTCPSKRIACSFQEPDYNQDGSFNLVECTRRLTRPPQSWRYVEEA